MFSHKREVLSLSGSKLEMRRIQVLSSLQPVNIPDSKIQTHSQAEGIITPNNKMIDDHQDHQEVDEIEVSHEMGIEIGAMGVDHQEDHLGKIQGVMQRG